LTQIVPFEMVDEALAGCGAVQRRLRKLPARVVVYLLLAAALFEDCGYLSVWAKLTTGLDGLPLPRVTATELWHARCRLGTRPLRALFDLVRGPTSAIRTTGARCAGLLVTAIDGTYLDVPDDPAVRAHLGKGSNQDATSGCPQICLAALVACDTRAVIDAAFGPRSIGCGPGGVLPADLVRDVPGVASTGGLDQAVHRGRGAGRLSARERAGNRPGRRPRRDHPPPRP
jgi:hypothetical protein